MWMLGLAMDRELSRKVGLLFALNFNNMLNLWFASLTGTTQKKKKPSAKPLSVGRANVKLYLVKLQVTQEQLS